MHCKRRKRTKEEEDCTMLDYNLGPYYMIKVGHQAMISLGAIYPWSFRVSQGMYKGITLTVHKGYSIGSKLKLNLVLS